jgi:hypothetical protein
MTEQEWLEAKRRGEALRRLREIAIYQAFYAWASKEQEPYRTILLTGQSLNASGRCDASSISCTKIPH